MDEIDDYRDRIEHRSNERRLKNDRRRMMPEVEQSKFWEPIVVINLLFFFAAGLALCFLGGD